MKSLVTIYVKFNEHRYFMGNLRARLYFEIKTLQKVLQKKQFRK